MSETTGIAWCDSTVNFWWGCQKVSPGCDHCYAEVIAGSAKFTGKAGPMAWGPNAPRRRIAGAIALAKKLNRKAIAEGKRLRVFTNSMADFFDNAIPEQWRHDAWAVIRDCTALDWLILSKRPQNFARFLPLDWGEGWAHVWLGVSAENQAEADRRIPILLDTPAALRWVSFEPLLSPIVLREAWVALIMGQPHRPRLWWAVIGGESGSERRDCGVEAIVNLARQCVDEWVPLFVKQDCAYRSDQQGRIPDEWFIREHPERNVNRTTVTHE